MNFREAGLYTNRSTIELKTEFEDVIEALEAIGYSKSITVELLDFWLYGSVPINYSIYLNLLNAENLLKKAGVPAEHINSALESTDRYLLLKNACLNFIKEELTSDFKPLVIDPLLKMYVQPSIKDKAERVKELSSARAIIKSVNGNISKTITTLEKMKPHHISGTDVENVLIDLKNIQKKIIN